MGWRRFWSIFVASAAGIVGLLFAFVVIVDPYGTLPFSPAFKREPVTTNQRFSFPALAASPRFDSAIFGTSTTRMLRPAKFNELFGARFANLSMNSATTHEQQRLYDLFIDHHPAPRMVVFGLDEEWCSTEPLLREFTFRPFPPWLYDGNPWNDALYLFNFSALEQAVRQFGYLTGLRPPKYGRDGYTNFLPPAEQYDLEKARFHIYGAAGPVAKSVITAPPQDYSAQRQGWRFTAHNRLRDMLARLPNETTKVLMLVPYHSVRLPDEGTIEWARWDECKHRLAILAAEGPNAHTIDFMIRSQITTHDENYWDVLHYSVETADRLAELIGTGIAERRGREGLFNYVQPE